MLKERDISFAGDFLKKTALLTHFLKLHESNLPETEYQDLLAETDRLIQVHMDILGQYQAGATRAQRTQELIDQQNLNYSHVAVSCAKGCGACCHLEVEIMEDDADRLAEAILSRGLSIDEERLRDQASRPRQDAAWAKGAVPANRCVMLDENNGCRVYDSRPSTCRKHAVITPAENCEVLGATPVPRLIPMNEIIMSASINLPGHQFGSYSKLLSKALEKRRNIEQVHALSFVEDPVKAVEVAEVAPELRLEDAGR
jgi:Fe-S-cluster containining protein